MKARIKTQRLILALAVLVVSIAPALADDPIKPNPQLTPGAVLTTDLSRICVHGYTKTVRHTSGKLKKFIYEEYGINPRGGHYEVDHLIPLEIGGANEHRCKYNKHRRLLEHVFVSSEEYFNVVPYGLHGFPRLNARNCARI